MSDNMKSAWDFFLAHFWKIFSVLLVVACGLYTIFVVKVFSPTGASREVVDLAADWQNSIAKLGISPLYPPQEDFFVGDVWAKITESPKPYLLGKAIRIAHINLTNAIRIAEANRLLLNHPHLDATPAPTQAVDKAAFTTTLISFPGVTFSHGTEDNINSVFKWWPFAATRKSTDYSDLRISSAETYGADLLEADQALDSFCMAKETAIKCSEALIRVLFASTIDSDIIQSTDTSNKFKFRIELVIRTYLATSIAHHTNLGGSVSYSASDQIAGADRGNQNKDQDGKLLNSTKDDVSDINLDEKLTAPLVFGYRALTAIPN